MGTIETMPRERTQANFHKLPGLLTRAEFQHWTGLSDGEIDEGVKVGEIRFRQVRNGGYRKYFKAEAARIAGFEF